MATKVLVVDDSALMRRQLRQILETAGGFEVRIARNGKEARELNRSYKPDVISLDINMPEMDGLTALAYIMTERPVPVIMVSSLSKEDTMITAEALALGAVDFICKPGGTISLSLKEIEIEVVNKIRTAAKAQIRKSSRGKSVREYLDSLSNKQSEKPRNEQQCIPIQGTTTQSGIVIIGVSTGGPSCLEEILPKLPEDFSFPVIVAQHMPANFTASFAERLDRICKLPVVEVNKLMPLGPQTIYIAKGGADVVLVNRSEHILIQPRPENPKYLWHPSVELLGQSVLEHYNNLDKVIAVMLTGMGHDGANSFTEIMNKGGKTIAESKETAVVFGMPQELIARNGATVVLPSHKIAGQIVQWASELHGKERYSGI